LEKGDNGESNFVLSPFEDAPRAMYREKAWTGEPDCVSEVTTLRTIVVTDVFISRH
jgi:hypothetical protein